MVDFASPTRLTEYNSSYLTPKFGTSGSNALTQQLYSSESYLVQSQTLQPGVRDEHWAPYLAKTAAAAPIDVIDAMAAITPWAERGDLNDSVYRTLGMDSAARWVEENKGSVEVASGILGAVVVGGLAEKAASRVLSSAWGASTGVGRVLASLGTKESIAMANAKQAFQAGARAGQTMRWTAPYARESIGWAMAGGVARAAVSEAAIVAALHKNEFIWTDDPMQNAMNLALGIGVGAALPGIMARGKVQKYLNSDEMQRAYAEAFDPTGVDQALTSVPLSGRGGNFVVKDSAMLTAFAINSRSADEGVAPTAAGVRSGIQTHAWQEVQRIIQSLGNRAIPGSKVARFSAEDAAGRQIEEAVMRDPTILYGAHAVGRTDVEGGIKRVIAELDQEADFLIKSKDAGKRARGQQLKKQDRFVLINRGLQSVDEAKPFLEFQPGNLDIKQVTPGQQEFAFGEKGSKARLTINEAGQLSKPIEKMKPMELMATLEASQTLLASMLKAQTEMTLVATPTPFQIDLAIEYSKAGGKLNLKNHPEVGTVEDLQMMSLGLKVDAIAAKPRLSLEDQVRFNLPAPTSAERVSGNYEAIIKRMAGMAKKEGATLDDVKAVRTETHKALDLTSDVQMGEELDGNMFAWNRASDKAGGKKQWMTPVLATFDQVPEAKWTKWDLGEASAEAQLGRQQSLARHSSAPVTQVITKEITKSPFREAARRIAGLNDGMLASTRNFRTEVMSSFLTAGHRNRHTPVLEAAQGMRRSINRIVEISIDDVFKRLAPHTNAFASQAGKRSKALFDQYWTHAGGWDIKEAIQLPDGMWAFVLDEASLSNKERLGRALEPDELMKNQDTGRVIAMDDMANSARVAMERELESLLKERNAIRVSRGLVPVSLRGFYTNPPKTRNKHIGFVLDAANRPVHGGTIIADTKEELARKGAEMSAGLPAGQRFLTSDQIKARVGLWEEAGLDFIDPARMSAPSKGRKGTLAGSQINSNAYHDALTYLKEGYEQVGSGVVESLFEPQIKIARMRSAAEKNQRGVPPGVKNIWDTYADTLLGRSPTANPVGLNALITPLEQKADQLLQSNWDKVTGTKQFILDVFDKVGRVPKSAKRLSDLADQLGPYTPFKQVSDLLEYERGRKNPPELKRFAAWNNRIAAGVILRWLEIPHAAMNLTGMITNMPGILMANNLPVVGKVKGAPVVDALKIMARASKRMLNKKSHPDWAHMERMGDAGQDIAQMHMQMSLIESKGSFMKVMTGDPAAKSFVKQKGIEGIASIMTDESENFARVWSHFVGLELADMHGIQGVAARNDFARVVANDAIANYDPLNRPEIYSSAFGTMYGLFLSYSQNYYQRLFRYMEDGDYKSMGVNMALQASMFGFTSLPGTRQLAALIGGEDEGEGMMDGIYQRYGSAVGSVVAHGGFNQLTTLFGMPAMSIHGRGDTNFRHPTADSLFTGQISMPVGLEVLSDLAGGAVQVLGGLVDPNTPMTAQYAAEIMARQMPNRLIKGALITSALGGREADAYGQLMAETKSFGETALRFLGLRSLRQQAALDAYFINRGVMEKDANRLDDLRGATRALIRAGKFDELPGIFDKYLDAGGSPVNYRNWIQDQIQAATETRSQNMLLESMRSPSQHQLANRIMLYTGGE